MPDNLQNSFAGGEWSSRLTGRFDLEHYATGARTMLNCYPLVSGALLNRAGTKYVNAVKTASKRVRLIPFIFNSDQSYVLEFGDLYLRFHQDGATLGGPYELVTPWTESQLPELKYAQLGDYLILTHPEAVPYVLRRLGDTSWELDPFDVARNAMPPTSLNLQDETGAAFNWDPASAAHDPEEWSWVVTSVDANGEESLPSAVLTAAATGGDPCTLYPDTKRPVLHWTAPASGNDPVFYNVYRGQNGIYGFVGFSVRTQFWEHAAVPDYSDTPPEQQWPFEIYEAAAGSATDRSATFSGGTAVKGVAAEAYDDRYTFNYTVLLAPGETADVDLKTGPSGGPYVTATSRSYSNSTSKIKLFNESIIVTVDGLSSATDEFVITKTAGSGTVAGSNVEWVENTGSEAYYLNYPQAVTFYDQRLLFGGFTRQPQTIKGSQLGDFFNFDRSLVTVDTDALDLTLAAKDMSEIRFLAVYDSLVVGTASGIWTVRGTEGSTLTPSNVDAKERISHHCSTLDPLSLAASLLFVADRNRRVREVTIDPVTGEFSKQARDLTVLAEHLLAGGLSIEEWAYQAEPVPIVWAIRSDGVLLGMTYDREHGVWGWHRHTTGASGYFESICCVPEGTETAVYVAVKRTVNGATVRYIERFSSREDPSDIADWNFLDCAAEYDGANTTATNLRIKAGDGWTTGTVVTLEASVSYFATPAMDSDRWKLQGSDGEEVEVESIGGFGYLSGTQWRVRLLNDVPASLQDIYTNTWWRGRWTLPGLTHLVAAQVNGLLDGNVAPAKKTVSGSGTVTFGAHAYKAQIGLAYNSDFQSLPLRPQQQSRWRSKTIAQVYLEASGSRAIQVGDSFDNMSVVQFRSVSSSYDAQSEEDIAERVRLPGRWDDQVSLCVRQADPVPMNLVALTCDVASENYD